MIPPSSPPAPDPSPDDESRSALSASHEASGGFSHDILLVEDDFALREMLRQVLRSVGYTLFEAANGRVALKYLSEQQARVIVTDIFMPETDGLELLTLLRKMLPRPPIIAMSGSMSEDHEVFLKIARHLGAKHTLIKPFPLKDLLAAVQATIGLPRLHSEAPPKSGTNPSGKS